MSLNLKIRLSLMMFIQFYIWGAWFVTMGTYLGKGLEFDGTAIGAAYSTTAWAAIISPFLVGMIADRFFSAEKVLAVCHLLGGVLMFFVSGIQSQVLFFWVLLAYAVCYMPTLALVNAVAFNQMTNPEKEFPPIRVLGTLGWIVAGSVITLMGNLSGLFPTDIGNIEATAIPLKMAAIASVTMGIYALSLPKTPPKSAGRKVTISDVLGLDALKMLKNPSFAVFLVSSLLITIPLAFYYAFGNLFLNEQNMTGVAIKMTLGQWSEIFFMLLIPFFFARFGIKNVLLMGMLAWVGRYVLFAFGNNESLVFMYYIGILLHGLCYDFFFVSGQIYVDKEAPQNIRASAQGLIALVTYGAGMVIGNIFAGWITQEYAIVDEAGTVINHDWQAIWIVPAIMAAAVAVAFAILFKPKQNIQNPEIQ